MTADRPTVLVTGANGFIGRHLAPLLDRNGWAVRCAVRQARGNDSDVVIGLIGPQTDWQTALSGVDAIVHLAARVHHPNEEHAQTLYQDVNVEGTLRLARAAVEAGVRQFIFVSTALVYGRSDDGCAPLRETNALKPSGLYGRSKVEAEVGLKSLAQACEMSVTVVRPPMVYGSGVKGNFALLAKAVKAGIPLPFAAIRNRRAFVSVQNLSSFISWRLANSGRRFDVFLVADGEQVSTPEFVRRLARAAGGRALLFPVPAPLLGFLLKISGRPEARESLLGSLELDTSKAASIGWKPQLTLDEGLRLALSTPGA